MPRIELNPGPLLRSYGEALRFVRILLRFRRYLRPQLPKLSLALLGALGFTVVTLLEPWPLQILFDVVLLHRKIHTRVPGLNLKVLANVEPHALLTGCVIAVLVLAVLRGQFYYMENVFAATSGQDVVMSIRRELFAHLQRLSLSFHRRAKAGDMLMRLTGDILLLREMVVTAVVNIMSHTLVVVGMLVVMAHMELSLTLVALALVPLLFLVLSVFRIRLVEAANRARKREGILASSAHEVLQGIHLVQASTAEPYEDWRFKEMNKRSLRASLNSARLEAQLNRAVLISIAAGLSAVLWLGTRRVMEGSLSPGQLLVFLAYVQGFYRPLRTLSKVTERMAKATACGQRVLEVLEEVPQIRDVPGAVTLEGVEGQITLRNVRFGYLPEVPVLRAIDLEIRPREKIALVGSTGAGKSTLLALILRFYDPQEGEILFDGVPIRNLQLKWLRRQISFLAQDTVIMGSTVLENIAYGAMGRDGPSPSHEEIELAARAARAHEFIIELPQGYDTVVTERGTSLSGGQRQRLAIARALLRQAPVLLLDEPMTGLDPIAERDVLEAFRTLAAGRTTLVVAHHLNTVLDADRIVFLRDGVIAEQGTHEGLLARGGPYAEFFFTQWKSFERVEEASKSPPLSTSILPETR
jgi:ATP-binding cassette subfamily B protein